MSKSMEVLKIEKETFFKDLGLKADEARAIHETSDEFIKAMIEIKIPVSVSDPEQGDWVSVSSQLNIPGTRFFINLTGLSKEMLTSSLSIIAKGITLGRMDMAEISSNLSSLFISSLIKYFMLLSKEQHRVIHAILDLKRAKKAVGYSPTTEHIAEKMEYKKKDLVKILDKMSDKVIKFDASSNGWKVIF